MSDEIDAVSGNERGLRFALTALQTPANRADNAKRSVFTSTAVIRITVLFMLLSISVLPTLALWTMWHSVFLRGDHQSFWVAILSVLPFATMLGFVIAQTDTATREHIQVLRGMFALRQAAATEDGRLAPTIEAPKSSNSDGQHLSKQAFSIVTDEQGVKWQRHAFVLGRRTVQASWQDVRAFVALKVTQSSKSGQTSDVFLLDTTSEALAWRITPKTPPSVREAHERFVRMANEHVPLRDITASLQNLLESPETRSYEYAVTALSSPTPVPPSVRKVLTTPIRKSHFLRGYLIVAAILLALLVAAGLLLQFGVIPAGSF